MESSKTRLSERIGEKAFIMETGQLAKQAAGAVLVQLGDSIVLAAVTMASKPKAEIMSFVPLTVDYRERTYAAGRIPGGFFKREGRPREKEILSSRLADRCCRPLFPEGHNLETQVQIVVLSADGKNDTDVLGINAASAALMVSNVPFNGPLGAVRIGRKDGAFIVNPTFEEREEGLELELVVGGKSDGILMVEGGGKEVSEELMLEAVALAWAEIKKICALQTELQQKAGKTKSPVKPLPYPEGFKDAMKALVSQPILDCLMAFPEKHARDNQLKELKKSATATMLEKHPASETLSDLAFEDVLYNVSRQMVLEKKVRADGRKYDEIRPITSQAPFLPRTHGSALFTRGQTQALATVTLGTPQDMQIMDELEGEYKERFMLHYNFPGFSVGEVKPERGQSRREIGHGALAKRALYALLPSNDEFPYTLRIVSDIMESNGSSSMASICGGSLALFDAGVPLKAACAGIAMGLIYVDGKYAVISDIMGFEDHLGDMDFKVAGSANGITAFQMDLKVEGISLDIMKEALMQAKAGRLHILGKMNEALDKPRPELSPFAPRLFKVVIPQDKIGALIGPGGKNIRRIQEETGAEVEVEDDGSVFISGLDAEKVKAAKEMVEFVTAEAEVGKIYKGKVVSIKEFGAFIEILPGKEGLCHISQLDTKRVAKTEDAVKEGDSIEVKVLEVDNMGKIRLSRKAVLQPGSEFEGDQGGRGGGGGGGGRPDRGPRDRRPAGRR